MSALSPLILQPIGIIHSPYREKFSVPRQPNLVKEGIGYLELLTPYNQAETVRGIEQFSHLWLIFQFHQIEQGKWHNTVRPPRLGGNQRIGVFASRSTHRPNPLGLSKVELREVECRQGKILLHLGSLDLVDGTPIFDIKPYIAYADHEPNANSGFAQDKPDNYLMVEFSLIAQQQLQKLQAKLPHFENFIRELIQQDPRPAYQQGKTDMRIYGMTLYEYNVRWQIKAGTLNIAQVLSIEIQR